MDASKEQGKPEQAKPKFGAKKIISWAGTLLMLVSLGFIVRRFMNYGIDFSLLTSPLVVIGLFSVAFGEGLAMLTAALNFRALVKNISGVVVERPLAMVVYLTSNLYKYIPGGVMYVAGRHRMVVETENLTHPKMVFATITEGVLFVIGALIVAVSLSLDHTMNYIRQLDVLPVIMLVLGIVLLAATVPLFIFRQKISAGLKKFWATVEILRFPVLVKRLSYAILLMFLWGLTFLLTLMLLGNL